MPVILAQISPQRSTQYGNIAKRLAPAELSLSPVGHFISSIDMIELGGREYLKVDIKKQLDEQDLTELGGMSMTSSFFDYYERLGTHEGPFLKPIPVQTAHELPYDLIMTRRYKGKTNEMFTHFMCNISRYSGSFSHMPWRDIRILDPLAGGGTTLFTALYLGAETVGIEKNSKDVKSTVAFLKQYTKEQDIPCIFKEERLKKSINKYWFHIGAEKQRCIIVNGDTADSAFLISGVKKPHCIVTDLPYGIQHGGRITDLLTRAIPVWSSILVPGGSIAMSWDSSRFSRKEMINLITNVNSLRILDGDIYENMAHRVDRVIKERDVIAVRKEE